MKLKMYGALILHASLLICSCSNDPQVSVYQQALDDMKSENPLHVLKSNKYDVPSPTVSTRSQAEMDDLKTVFLSAQNILMSAYEQSYYIPATNRFYSRLVLYYPSLAKSEGEGRLIYIGDIAQYLEESTELE